MENHEIDLIEVADALAEIARTTTDARTGRLLIEVIKHLLEAAGLPPQGAEGGGELPPSDHVCVLLERAA